MILKLIIFAIVAIYVYKLFGGTLPSFSGTKKPKKKRDEVDTMVECCKCGTYITNSEAVVIQGKFYCDECV